ncbi:hypothetical protein [Bathymodiolus japonicus methanotrophic gill symbiont]|uniref:hypothetical protein n=1 Tax=Bathymodiolus japonicus methanotrophic gill symbiont TaxID=113269 RepID=UPI001C8D3933|nr:hypothetical protein [Bathymodiolus japonicus methanotrophic gill symbiont]
MNTKAPLGKLPDFPLFPYLENVPCKLDGRSALKKGQSSFFPLPEKEQALI